MAATTSEKKKSERFEARLAPEAKERLQRAAELRGCSISDFVLNSALAAAEETIRAHELLQLSARDTKAFLDAIENPPVFDEKMREAARRHQGLVQVVW